MTVSDSGKGIPAQDLPKVFEAFRTTEQPISAWHSGTGLGLPISKKFVELHRGQMGVESLSGEETTFWFTLPCVQTRTPKIGRVETSEPSAAAPAVERILIVVSDDPHRANLIHRYLPDYRIAQVAHLPEGIALAAESHADAILADESIKFAEELEESGFFGTAAADDAHDITRPEGEINILQRLQVPEPYGKVRYRQR